jgi:hypothetical protein
VALAALSRVSPRNEDNLERLCQDRHFIQEFVDIDKLSLMGLLWLGIYREKRHVRSAS